MNYLLILDDDIINMNHVHTIRLNTGTMNVVLNTAQGPLIFRSNQALRLINWLTAQDHKEILRNNTIVHVII